MPSVARSNPWSPTSMQRPPDTQASPPVTDHDATVHHDSEPKEHPDTSPGASRAANSASAEEAGTGSAGDDPGSAGRRRRRRGRRGRGRRGGGGQDGAATQDGSGTATSDAAVASAEDAAGTDDAQAGTDDAGGGSPDARDDAAAEAAGSDAVGGQTDDADAGDTERGGSGRKARGDRGGSQRGSSRSGSRTRSATTASRRDRSRDDDGAGDGDAGDGDGGSAAAEDRAVEDAIAKGGTRMAAKRGGRRSSGGGNGGRRASQRSGGVAEEVRRAILEGPPRTMLVTAREDRTQIAVLEDRTVVEHYVTRAEDVTFVGNIYMARVQNVLPGMEAAFLDIGKGRNGVLYAGEVLYDELDLEEGDAERIENALKPGQKVLVQVTKDPMGSKGPRLTMHLSLAGRYMVLAPNSDLFGISRKLTDKERDRLRRIVKQVKPDHHGVIVRTAAEGATEEQVVADVERLLAKWARVEQAAADAKALTAVYEEPPLVVKVIRDNFGPEFIRCTVDDEDLYHQVRSYLSEVAPELEAKVELYGAPTADARARAAGAPPSDDATNGQPLADPSGADTSPVPPDAPDAPSDVPDAPSDVTEGATAAGAEAVAAPVEVDLQAAAERRGELPTLFTAYDVTDQLRKAMGKKVWLPSGGYLIIETTEAMKVIDVNTGRFTGGKDTNLEEVVLKTNLEAADEIVRQLRLRDMGGIIVIDFIDMLLKANQEQVVRRLKRELLRDRTKTRVSEVSKLGLVQMTRKNVSQGLIESFSHTCEHCEGRGIQLESP